MQDKDNEIKKIADGITTAKGLRTYKRDAATAQDPSSNDASEMNKKKGSVKLPPPIPVHKKPANIPVPAKKPTLKDERIETKTTLEEIKKTEAGEEEKLKIKKEIEIEDEIKKIDGEKTQLEEQLGNLLEKELALKNEREGLLVKKSEVDKRLYPVTEKERVVEKIIKEIEMEESATTNANSRRIIEQKRWSKEEDRRNTEKEKWNIEKELEGIIVIIEEKEGLLKNITDQKKAIHARIEEIAKAKEKHELQQKLKKISKIKEKFELEWIALNDNKETLGVSLKPVLEREGVLEKEKELLEEKEREAPSGERKREIEQKRWGVEGERKSTEEQRWNLEKKLEEVTQKIETLKPKYQDALMQEENTQKKLDTFS